MTAKYGKRASIGARFFARPAEVVAPALLGAIIVTTIEGVETAGRIVEAEAYIGPDDDASHAAARIGRTRRNAIMFGEPGLAYVYRSYGVHWCLNVVTNDVGFPAAVLIRAFEPLSGIAVMRRRRGLARGAADSAIGRGPGNLTRALGITGDLDGHALDEPPLRIIRGPRVAPASIDSGPRIGISRAVELPYRFWIRNHPCVSNRRA